MATPPDEQFDGEALLADRQRKLEEMHVGDLAWEYFLVFRKWPTNVQPPVKANIIERIIRQLRAEMERTD